MDDQRHTYKSQYITSLTVSVFLTIATICYYILPKYTVKFGYLKPEYIEASDVSTMKNLYLIGNLLYIIIFFSNSCAV